MVVSWFSILKFFVSFFFVSKICIAQAHARKPNEENKNCHPRHILCEPKMHFETTKKKQRKFRTKQSCSTNDSVKSYRIIFIDKHARTRANELYEYDAWWHWALLKCLYIRYVCLYAKFPINSTQFVFFEHFLWIFGWVVLLFHWSTAACYYCHNIFIHTCFLDTRTSICASNFHRYSCGQCS